MQENENATHIYYLHWLLYIDAATILLFNTNFSPRTATADANYSVTKSMIKSLEITTCRCSSLQRDWSIYF
jgi:hypothetical protein